MESNTKYVFKFILTYPLHLIRVLKAIGICVVLITVCVMCKQGLRKEDEEIVEAADYTLHGYIP